MSTAGASILGVGYLIPMVYFIWSMRYGPHATSNPWGAFGLEWMTSSPPPTENFPETPVVTWEAYEFRPYEETQVIGGSGVEEADIPEPGPRTRQ
jgi:cytochrome c oxidase subunit 1